MKYIFLVFSLLLFTSFQEKHSFLGVEFAKKELKEALSEHNIYPTLPKRAIKDKQTAIAIAEPILFKGYGKQQIIDQRPYEIYLIRGYWIINGTLPERMTGGGFAIVLSGKDGKIMRIIHYK